MADIEYERVLYKGKEEYSMEEFEALTTLDDAVDYNILDYPVNSITNTQMTFALTCKRLFPQDCSFVCSDNGTYIKGHIYKINVNGEAKTWEDITPNGGGGSTSEKIQYDKLPQPSAQYVNKIVQYVGDNDLGSEKTGHWYKCKAVNAEEGRFQWVDQDVQIKDYEISTGGWSSAEGKMMFASDATLSWRPYISLGSLPDLETYTGNITVAYKTQDTWGSETDYEQVLVYHHDPEDSSSDGWYDENGSNEFYMIGKAANTFGIPVSQPLYIALYQGNNLNKWTSSIKIISISKDDKSVISISGDYGEGKFYDYAADTGYSLPIDFYSKFEQGAITESDIELFRFLAFNTWETNNNISNLKICINGDTQSLQNALGMTPTQYKELPDLPINESNKVIQYIGETSNNQFISPNCVINLGLIPYDRSTTYTMTWDIGGDTYNTTLTKDESILAWISSQDQPEDSKVNFILISTANQFNQGTIEGDTDTEKYCVVACQIPKESYTIIKHIKNKGNIHIQDINSASGAIFHMGQTQGLDNLAKFDLMRRENEIYSSPRDLAQAIKNEYLSQDLLKSFNFASTYEYEYNLLLDTTYKSGIFQITFNKDNTCMIPNGLPDYEISSDCTYSIIPEDHIIEIYENGTFKLNLYVDDTYRSFKFSSPDNFDKVYVFTGGFTKGYFYTNPEISISSGYNWLQWEYLKI